VQVPEFKPQYHKKHKKQNKTKKGTSQRGDVVFLALQSAGRYKVVPSFPYKFLKGISTK
jgi:hypothetical protein